MQMANTLIATVGGADAIRAGPSITLTTAQIATPTTTPHDRGDRISSARTERIAIAANVTTPPTSRTKTENPGSTLWGDVRMAASTVRRLTQYIVRCERTVA